jgi:predicted RNase H-like nuclease (RuvC/YqgF family)
MDWALLIPTIAAIVGPLTAYVLAVRRTRGRINTSEASDLWKESASIREDYRTRLLESSDRTRDLEKRVARLEQANNELLAENLAQKERIIALEKRIISLQEEIVKLNRVITTQEDELRKLRAV